MTTTTSLQKFVCSFAQCFVAELSAYEAQIGEYKGDMARMGNDMRQLKKKYYVQKRKLQKMKEAGRSTHEPALLPGISVSGAKFCGGGFKMATPTTGNCRVPELAAR